MLVEHNGATEFPFGHAVALEFVEREVDSVALDVFANVSQHIRELHENPPRFSIFSGHRVVIAVDFNAHQADDGSNTVAIDVEFVEGAVSVVVKVVFHAGDQVVKHVSWNVVALDRVLECQEHGVGGMHVAVAGGELLAEEEELGDLVEVGFLIEDGAPVLEGFELVPVGRCFGVEFASAPREAVRPVAVGNVVRSATEGVDGAHGQALFLREVLERVIEIAGFPHG